MKVIIKDAVLLRKNITLDCKKYPVDNNVLDR